MSTIIMAKQDFHEILKDMILRTFRCNNVLMCWNKLFYCLFCEKTTRINEQKLIRIICYTYLVYKHANIYHTGVYYISFSFINSPSLCLYIFICSHVYYIERDISLSFSISINRQSIDDMYLVMTLLIVQTFWIIYPKSLVLL